MPHTEIPPESQDEKENFLVEVLTERLSYFERIAVRSQKISLTVRFAEALLAVSLPSLISLRIPTPWLLAVSIVLALLVLSSQVWQFDAKWRQYRLIADQLKRELFMFRAHVDEYSIDNPVLRAQIFMDRTTKLIDSELSRWLVSSVTERAS